MQYELSICIPTYNREKYLKEALDSIVNQLDDTNRDKVEICVSDNASKDDTKELVESYRLKHPHITYFRWDKNMGADNNYLKSVEIAVGKYCWILGSDDIINEGAINKILSQLQLQYDIYLCNVKICDINMKFMHYFKCLKNSVPTTVFEFSDSISIEKYLKTIKKLAGLFGYLSSLIFLKAKWDNIKGKDEFIGTAYVHSYILLSILKDKSTLKYICQYLVSYRGYNDHFALEGMQKRILLDLNGIPLLIHKVFNGCIDTNYYAKEMLSRHYGFRSHLYFMSSLNDNELIEKRMLEIGYKKFYLQLCKSLKYPYLAGKKIKAVLRRLHVCN